MEHEKAITLNGINIRKPHLTKINNPPLVDKQMNLKRCFETQKEVEANICHSEACYCNEKFK